ncbi:unnamed protein product, partial [Polarella glacialis]
TIQGPRFRGPSRSPASNALGGNKPRNMGLGPQMESLKGKKIQPASTGQAAALRIQRKQQSLPVPDDEALFEEDKTRRACLQKQLRKTKFCMYHLQGVCQFGANCAFAHDLSELQGAPDLRKTRLCKSGGGPCKDPTCTFAHNEDELRSTQMFYKKTLCIWYEKGRCRNGDQCRFAHGSYEVRPSDLAEAQAAAAAMRQGAPHAAVAQGSRSDKGSWDSHGSGGSESHGANSSAVSCTSGVSWGVASSTTGSTGTPHRGTIAGPKAPKAPKACAYAQDEATVEVGLARSLGKLGSLAGGNVSSGPMFVRTSQQ